MKEKYRLDPALRAAFKKATKEANAAAKVEGGMYFYKGSECSCCYGGRKANGTSWDWEINGNIPQNWGVYDAPESAYHKISFDLTLSYEQICLILAAFSDALESAKIHDWRVRWDGHKSRCIMIERDTRHV